MKLTESKKYIPMYYTGIQHPQDPNKELVIMALHGDYAICCYRKHSTNRLGIKFSLKVVYKAKIRFLVFKSVYYGFSSFNKVW